MSNIPYKPRTTTQGRDPQSEAISTTDTRSCTSASASAPTSQYGPAHTMLSRREHRQRRRRPMRRTTGSRAALSTASVAADSGPATAIAASLRSRPGRSLAVAQHALADGHGSREPGIRRVRSRQQPRDGRRPCGGAVTALIGSGSMTRTTVSLRRSAS
ncbi:hypothetical protein DL771_002960 [Monosporascus sp. 5C6A]|nr:hypothetical protein DL771_002960 [Monosporascus sp. 5C6A]